MKKQVAGQPAKTWGLGFEGLGSGGFKGGGVKKGGVWGRRKSGWRGWRCEGLGGPCFFFFAAGSLSWRYPKP